MLQFFSASTSIVNSRRAINECFEMALEGEPNLDCDLLIIYTGMGHNFQDLLNEAHIIAPNAQLVGCTCAGCTAPGGGVTSSARVMSQAVSRMVTKTNKMILRKFMKCPCET